MDYPIGMIKTYLSSFLESINILSHAQIKNELWM